MPVKLPGVIVKEAVKNVKAELKKTFRNYQFKNYPHIGVCF